MTALAPVPSDVVQLSTVRVRHWKLPITLAIATVLLGLLFLLVPRDGVSTFRLGDPAASVSLPNVSVPTAATCWIVLAIMVLLTAWAFLDAWAYRRTGMWLSIVFGVLGIFAFLVWASAGGLVPVTGLLFGALSLSIPLIFGALGGVIGERVGVVNVAIEGQFLFGAFSAADAMYAPVVLRFRTYEVQVSNRAYMEAVLALPAMKEWITAAEREAESIPQFDMYE